MKFFYQIKNLQGMKWRSPGFSFPETIVALGLMGLLASIAAPIYMDYKQDSVINKMIEDAGAVRRKIDMCFRYAELHDCVDDDGNGNCESAEREKARWEACTKKTGSSAPNKADAMVKLGLIPCSGGAMAVSTSCDEVKLGGSKICVTLNYKKQKGCVLYDAKTRDFTVCVDPDPDAAIDKNKGTCPTTCDRKKGYECDGTPKCACAS